MLKQLRHKKTAKKIFIFLAIIIVPAFVLWGSGSLLRDKMKASHAGEIFGKKISMKDFRDTFLAVRTQSLIRFGDNFYQIEPMLNLEERAWERLILLHKARKQNLKVSNEDVIKRISEYQFFQKDGKFNNEIYQQVLRYGLGINPRDFERHVRESLIIERLFKLQKKIIISEQDLRNEFKKESELVKVAYIALNNEDFKKDIAISQKETKDYFQNNKEDFRTKPQINIEYIGIELEQEANLKNKSQAREQMLSILEKIKKGGDLLSISKEGQLKYKKSGLFNIDEPIPDIGWSIEFFNAISSLKSGQISDLIETTEGYYIARLLEVKQPYLPDFEEVTDMVVEVLKAKEAGELALKKAYEIKAQLQEELKKDVNIKFNQLIKRLNLTGEETQFFKRSQYLERIGISDEFSKASFSLVDNPSELAIASSPKASFIIKLMEFKPVDEEKFQKEKEEYRNKIRAEKEQKAFYNFLQELKGEAQLKSNIDKNRRLAR